MDCATFTIVNDNLVEGDHGFSVTITNVGPSAMIGMPDTTVITINDNDRKSACFRSYIQYSSGPI